MAKTVIASFGNSYVHLAEGLNREESAVYYVLKELWNPLVMLCASVIFAILMAARQNR